VMLPSHGGGTCMLNFDRAGNWKLIFNNIRR